MDQTKPFTHLNNAKGKQIIVELKNDAQYNGILESFDMHLNLVLIDVKDNKNNKSPRVLIRGDMIVSIKDL